VISAPILCLSALMHCGDFFWLPGRYAVLNLPVSLTNAVGAKICINACHSHSTTILRRGLWHCEIIDKLIDSISRLRQLWVHCYSVWCISSLATFSRHYRHEYIWLAIHRHKCHAGWWATQLQYLSVIDLTETTQVIVITRLHAMYQRSGRMLVFLSVIFLAIQIICVVMGVLQARVMFLGELQL